MKYDEVYYLSSNIKLIRANDKWWEIKFNNVETVIGDSAIESPLDLHFLLFLFIIKNFFDSP